MTATAGAAQPFVGGAWVAADERFDVLDPATGMLVARVGEAKLDDARAALDAAVAVGPAWSAKPPRARAELLAATARALLAREDELATTITHEMGKPLREARDEVRYAAGYLSWFAEEAVRAGGRTAPLQAGGGRLVTVREPVGPCLLVTPWNFPLAMAARKLGPALAAGCTAILKPAEDAPLSALLLAGALADAGLPDGVVSVLPTSRPAPLVAALLADPRLRKLSFTGSTAVGRLLLAQAADGVLRTSMELGGTAPFVVFADADLDAAVEAALVAKLRNGGQACTAANRFLVEAAVAGRFAERLAERMAALRVGRGIAPDTDLGPLVNPRQRERVAALVDEAVTGGATVLCGGGGDAASAGCFFSPTVVTEIPPGARLLHEEIFGPVAPIVPFADEAEALRFANDGEHGLAAYFCTRDLDRALRVSAGLRAGMVAVNRGTVSAVDVPFGGVAASGLGREGGAEGIDEYLETKAILL